jgi:probable rRNA maturation factor
VAKSQVKALLRALMKHLECSHSEISVYFVTTKKISELHDQFFDDPTTTDCISFPIDEEHLGEIFVCPETAVSYAKKHKIDAQKELTLYIVHGLLHCLGFDDLTPAKKRIMRKKEKNCMQFLEEQELILS